MRDTQPAGQPIEVPSAVAADAPRPPASPSAPTSPVPGQAPRSPASATQGAPSRRVSDGAQAPVLPDCCNMGIALRVLVPLNAAGLLLVLATTSSSAGFTDRLVEMAMVLEPAAVLALVALCALRRHVNGRSRTLQWGAGIGVPAAATMLVSLAAAPSLIPSIGPLELALWVGARGLAAAALAALAIEYFRLRALSFSPSLSEARLQALQARIRPHFLFNSLNTVLGLMRGDPRRAEYTLENLADLFRVFMRDTRELVPLDEEVVTCQQYLAIEQLRLGDRLEVRWQVEQMPGDALLPSLLLQPLVENAVHHGIEPLESPGEIVISITRPGDRVRVEILNPAGEGAPVRAGNQMALSNVRERLMLLYDMEAELKTVTEDGQFRLLLEFPYRKERRRRDVRRHFNPYR